MPWDDLIRSLLTTVAKPILGDGLLAFVTHFPVRRLPNGEIQRDDYGNAVYGNGTFYHPVVEDSDEKITTMARETVIARYKLTFLEEVVIDPDDKITVDGRFTPILRINKGVQDDQNQNLITEVVVG